MTTTRGPTLAAAHGVVDGVHHDAAVVRATAEPAGAAGLAELHAAVVAVAEGAHGRAAVDVDPADLTGGQADLRPVAFAGHQAGADTGGADQLAAAADLDLDVVDHRADRDDLERQAVARLDVGGLVADHGVADAQALGGQDVALVAVREVDEGDEAGAVRVVLDGRDLARDAEVVALEVDRAVQLLVTATAEARGDAAVVVVPGVIVEVLDQRAVRNVGGDAAALVGAHPAATGRGRPVDLDAHDDATP